MPTHASRIVALALLLLVALPCRGEDPPRPLDVVNKVEGQTTILAIVANGVKVKKGDVLFELDSAALKDRLTNQQIILAQSKAELESAKKSLEVATSSEQEVQMGANEDVKSTENDVKISELDIKIAKTAVDQEKAKILTQGERGTYDKAVAALARAEASLKKNKAKLKSLKDVIVPKRLLEAKLNVGKAETDSKTLEGIHRLEMSKLDKLNKMIELCTVTAPTDGQVYYANPDPPRADGYQIEEGALVRQRQVIVRIVPE